MNKIFVVLVFGLVLLGFVSGVSVDDSIYEQFDNGAEKVRVLVKVNDAKVSKGFGVSSSKSTSVEDIIESGQINRKVGDYVSAYVSKSELEVLVKNGNIESVDVEQTYYTMLQDSVGIINASSAWNLELSGLNLTGTNHAVCIIDSGVNYSHADLGGCSSSEFTAGTCGKVIGGWDFCADDATCSTEDDDVMDVYGHGTHVSGIVAANGDIHGIGLGTNIVMMKASNSSGVFWTTDVASAIDRCVANASVFNISVISMSLGAGQYTSYCDGSDALIASSINDAVANNIAVVVATGNTGGAYLDPVAGISSPACIENATRATASTKADAYASYAFRHSNFPDILVAPGSSINSTVVGGVYGLSSGTSMATPMVAGAIAIINQYLGLSGQTKTPSEISNILNDSGVILDDSAGSGYDFSRVDIYSALLSLDVDAPNVTLVSPIDNNINLSVNQSFVCNATDWQLANMTFKIWNSSELYYNETKNLTGIANETSFNVTEMAEGAYSWNCFAADVLGNVGNASNYTLTIGGVSTTLVSPVDENYTATNDTNFSCNVSSDVSHDLSNVTFYLWNSSGVLNYSETEDISGFSNTSVFNFTFVEEGNYSWNCFGVNNGSNSSWGDSNFSLIYDTTVPVISSAAESVSASGATISWTTDEAANSSVSVSGGSWSNSSSYVTDHSVVVSGLAASTAYSYNISSCDRAGNCGNETDSFTTSATASTGGSSPSGGGATTSSSVVAAAVVPEPEVFEVSADEVSGGYTKILNRNEKINFSIFDSDGERHLLSVNKIGNDYINLTIESDPINFKLGVGQSAKFNLSSVDYYDLMVKLNSITSEGAELTIQLINEPIEKVVEKVIEGDIVETVRVVIKNYFWVVIALIVVLVAIVYVVLKKRKAKKLKGSKAKKKNGRKSKKAEA
ncbi:S8 family serine peptidase [archaeon]|jgi:chitodextrinase|nr:S8 family serine peptidase [archaeon]